MAIGQDLEQYFVDISTGCPYGLEQKSVYHQAMFTSLDDAAVGHFLENGYRRNGNCMYAMRCPSATAVCRSVFARNPFAPTVTRGGSGKRIWMSPSAWPL